MVRVCTRPCSKERNKSAKNKMVNAGLLFLVALLFFVFVSEDTEAATYTVDEFGGSDYTNITQAVENASAGDTIKVASRTYHDNVTVNKKLTIIGGNYGVNLEHLYDCHFEFIWVQQHSFNILHLKLRHGTII